MPLLVRTLMGIHCAYIDPNVGGWLFQLIFPVIVAIGGFGMVLRRRIKRAWQRCFGPVKDEAVRLDETTSPQHRAVPTGSQSAENNYGPERQRD